MSFKLCLVVTDAVSFNVLYRGQLEYLANSGFSLTLLCGGSRDEIQKLRDRDVGDVIDLGMVRKPDLWPDAQSLLKLTWHFATNRYDLVVMSTPKALLLGSVAAFVARQPRRVAFFQGRVYENFTGLRRAVYSLLDRITIFCVQEVLFVSESLMAELVEELPSAAGKGRVLGGGSGNGVCMRRFSPGAVPAARLSSLRRELAINDSEFVVLVIGRICHDKGLAELNDVIRLIAVTERTVRFLFVGRPEEADAYEQLKALRTSGLVIHVDFTQDVVPYFALADVHLFLTHREGFGNVAIEAAAMGIPTIGFDVVGVRDSVLEGISGYRLPRGDTAAVVAALRALYADRQSIRHKFAGARTWVDKRFSQPYVWKNYAEFYRAGRTLNE